MTLFSRVPQRIVNAVRHTSTVYPFSKNAIIPATPVAPPESAKMGKGLMEYVNKNLPSPEKQEFLQKYFSRHSSECLVPGSILTVKMEYAPALFTGVLLGIRRRGVMTSFVLRNIVQRTGVEMQIFPCSPLVKEIIVERLPPRGRMRRAKLFYLRDSPDKMSALARGRLKFNR